MAVTSARVRRPPPVSSSASSAKPISKTKLKSLDNSDIFGGVHLVVDAMSELYRQYHFFPNFTNSAGLPTGALYGFFRSVRSLQKTYGATEVSICWDDLASNVKKSKVENHQLSSTQDFIAKPLTYKSNRSFETKTAMLNQIPYIKNAITYTKWNQYFASGYEADDLVATLASSTPRSLIDSGDRDLFTVVFGNVWLYFGKVGIYGDGALPPDFFGVPTFLIPVFKALKGDKSDNLKVLLRGPSEEDVASRIVEVYNSLESTFFPNVSVLPFYPRFIDSLSQPPSPSPSPPSSINSGFKLPSMFLLDDSLKDQDVIFNFYYEVAKQVSIHYMGTLSPSYLDSLKSRLFITSLHRVPVSDILVTPGLASRSSVESLFLECEIKSFYSIVDEFV